jgi:ABC-type transporter Mla MlaB component
MRTVHWFLNSILVTKRMIVHRLRQRAMPTIRIPTHINAGGLLPFLSLLGKRDDQPEIALDFAGLHRVTPAGVAALVATVVRWQKQGRRVTFEGLRKCPILGYLQRMDALSACGVNIPEDFSRHDSQGRFLPVRLVDSQVEKMGREIAACLAPGGDEFDHPMAGLYDFSFYVLTEVANNIRQHSSGVGYATAQSSRHEGYVRLALADSGMGIRGSFQHAGYPWSETIDDAGAIAKALESRVSCKCGDPNEGVGLTLVSQLAKLSGAWLLIVSGSGVLRISPKGGYSLSQLPEGGYYQGTLMTMVVPQKAPSDFAKMLNEAKVQAGLLRMRRATGRFEP